VHGRAQRRTRKSVILGERKCEAYVGWGPSRRSGSDDVVGIELDRYDEDAPFIPDKSGPNPHEYSP
jgi:hypothetical protein